jgi:hypothetical protein
MLCRVSQAPHEPSSEIAALTDKIGEARFLEGDVLRFVEIQDSHGG